jgi:putative endonuclease
VRTYYVYIMASRSRVLYTGVTNNLTRRVSEHKRGLVSGFTRKYRIARLVYFEEFADIRDAIAREKEIKGWKRLRKISVIESRNPTWEDLAKNWFLFPHKRTCFVVGPKKQVLRAFGAQDDRLARSCE